MHVAVYLGWIVARRLDDLLVDRRPPRRRHPELTAATDVGPGRLAHPVLAGGAVVRPGARRLERLRAVLTSDTWENACGKLPSMPLGDRVVLLGQQADVVAQRQQPLEQRARLVGAARAARRLSASQNEQGRNAPSPGGRPSTAVVGPVAQHEAVAASARARSRRPCRRRAGRRPAGSRPAGSSAALASSACEP